MRTDDSEGRRRNRAEKEPPAGAVATGTSESVANGPPIRVCAWWDWVCGVSGGRARLRYAVFGSEAQLTAGSIYEGRDLENRGARDRGSASLVDTCGWLWWSLVTADAEHPDR